MAMVATRPHTFLSRILEAICIDLQLRDGQVRHANESYCQWTRVVTRLVNPNCYEV